jgi:hypothetical protein
MYYHIYFDTNIYINHYKSKYRRYLLIGIKEAYRLSVKYIKDKIIITIIRNTIVNTIVNTIRNIIINNIDTCISPS